MRNLLLKISRENDRDGSDRTQPTARTAPSAPSRRLFPNQSDPERQPDPFNAGEPVLPWEEPDVQTFRDFLDDEPSPDSVPFQEVEEVFDEAESDDATVSPIDDHDIEVRRRDGTSGAIDTSQDSARALDTLQDVLEDIAGYSAPTKQSDNYRAPLEKPDEQETLDEAKRDLKRAFGKKVRDHREHGQKRSRVGLLIAVAVILIMNTEFIFDATDALWDAISGKSDTGAELAESPGAPTGEGLEIGAAYSDQEESEAAMMQVADERLSAVTADDTALMDSITAAVENTVESYFGRPGAEVGVDARAIASWLVDNFTYGISSAYIPDGGEGIVYFDCTAPVCYSMISDAYTDACDYIDGELADAGDEGSIRTSELTEPQKQRIAQIVDEAMGASITDEPNFGSLDLKLEGDTWAVDEKALPGELCDLFAIY